MQHKWISPVHYLKASEIIYEHLTEELDDPKSIAIVKENYSNFKNSVEKLDKEISKKISLGHEQSETNLQEKKQDKQIIFTAHPFLDVLCSVHPCVEESLLDAFDQYTAKRADNWIKKIREMQPNAIFIDGHNFGLEAEVKELLSGDAKIKIIPIKIRNYNALDEVKKMINAL